MTLLEQFKTAREVYLSLINEHSDDIIREIVKELGIKYPGLTTGMIIGYTPEWNDGEACEHSSDIQIQYIDDSIEEFMDLAEDHEFNNLSREDAREISKELDLVDIILHEIYGTNYQFAFTIIDGTVTIKREYYECGY
ncbi:hypothetical protein GAP32_155 [Cronobacter phage vB_CsaM_GAP32]|uniref:Uncharacterized protein n=1 Tax=Cronobacter phage vB_CsaM_GAP32 TaxID=1141136 RepID=K4F9J1_9CAUD|nr:hypothetical protein GAP32_155 [Cronobacter phage vB_CsaM_GAP32]AFC21605.1 hypothetical protein GAP32_155 [Cronobacter phage vB_CsaM_GAP32]